MRAKQRGRERRLDAGFRRVATRGGCPFVVVSEGEWRWRCLGKVSCSLMGIELGWAESAVHGSLKLSKQPSVVMRGGSPFEDPGSAVTGCWLYGRGVAGGQRNRGGEK